MTSGEPGRVLVTGTFCSLNRGDAAMRIALIDALRRGVPNCHITVMTPFPELDAGVYACDSLTPCSRRHPRRVAGMIMRALGWRLANSLFGADCTAFLNSELLHYRRSDVVVDLSGDGLTEEYGSKCLISHLVPILLARMLRRPIFVCAQTIGPFRHHERLCRWLLAKVNAISAREKLSHDYIKSLGLAKPAISLTADLAFLMQSASRERAQAILASEGVPTDRPLVGFSVSRLPGHFQGSPEGKKTTPFENEIAETIDKAVELGLTPVLISHTFGPGVRRDDRRAAERVADLAQSRDAVYVIRDAYAAEEIKAVIAEMDLMVGLRMHSCIAALSSCVPVISIAYGPKAFGIMSLAGQSEWVVDIADITSGRLFGLVKRAWEDRRRIQNSLLAHVPEVLSMSLENVKVITALIASRSDVVTQHDVASIVARESGNVTGT